MPADVRCQTHLVRLGWPWPYYTHVYGQQIFGFLIHLSLPAPAPTHPVRRTVQKRLGRTGEVRVCQGCKATQTQLFYLAFRQESRLDTFNCLACSRQMVGEGMAQGGQTNHDHHHGNHSFYETETSGRDEQETPAHSLSHSARAGTSALLHRAPLTRYA